MSNFEGSPKLVRMPGAKRARYFPTATAARSYLGVRKNRARNAERRVKAQIHAGRKPSTVKKRLSVIKRVRGMKI